MNDVLAFRGEDRLTEADHDTTSNTTHPREPEPDPLGERIARSVEARLEDFHAYHLTGEEFATIAKYANSLQRGGTDLEGFYKASDILVEVFARNGGLGKT